MDPATGAASIGGSLLVKLLGFGEKKRAANRAKEREAKIAQWSPWTKMQAQRVEDPSLIRDLLSGAGWGLMINDALQGQGVPSLPVEGIASSAAEQGLNPLYASIYDPTRMA